MIACAQVSSLFDPCRQTQKFRANGNAALPCGAIVHLKANLIAHAHQSDHPSGANERRTVADDKQAGAPHLPNLAGVGIAKIYRVASLRASRVGYANFDVPVPQRPSVKRG
jgi:hypothetical protein